jgi:hypothetical protein
VCAQANAKLARTNLLIFYNKEPKKMTTTTFIQLYADRCDLKEGKLIPHFWKPKEIPYAQPCLFGDERSPCEPDWNVDRVLSRILALGLKLELPVGEFIAEASKNDLPAAPTLAKLLKTNIADEAAHYRGFELARESYNVAPMDLVEAQVITAEWQSINCHAIEAAQALETGVFLATLGFLRLAGGKSLCNMAGQIARDEYRHVATNRGILAALGYPLMPDFWSVVQDSLAWVFEGLNIPKSKTGMKVDSDFFIKSGKSLLQTGEARQLDDLVGFVHHNLPFEISNSELYNRASE